MAMIDDTTRVPLRVDTDVVVIPDSLAGYFPPIAAPAELAVPVVAEPDTLGISHDLVPVTAPSGSDTADYCRWTADEYIVCGLVAALVATAVGIVVAAVHVIAGVFAAVSAVFVFATSAGGVIATLALVVLAWRLISKFGAKGSSASSVHIPTVVPVPTPVSSPAQESAPVARPTRWTVRAPKAAPAATPVTEVVQEPSPVDFPVDEPTSVREATERRHWWGGLTDQAKASDRQERLTRLDPRAQQWVADLRDASSVQAKGTYDDESGRYCAVGIETHKNRRMSHQQMCRAFGRHFVHDVEKFNDSTKATFEDVARYIEDNL